MKQLEGSPPAGSPRAMPVQAAGEVAAYRPWRAWSMVSILSAMLVLSFIDRLSLTVLVGPVKHDLLLSDTQIGLLLGTAFGVFYSTVGLPLGYLIDRYNRRNLLVAGVVIWSLMTILSGFAQDFTTLFIGRMGVGFGEAVLTPVAYSLIKDSFPEHRRGRAYGLYMFGASVGTGAALVVAGSLSRAFEGVHLDFLPILAHLSSWQYVLIAIGLVGLPIAASGLLIREPTRQNGEGLEAARLSAVLKHASANRRFYAPLLVVYAIWGVCIFSYGAWVPTAIGRVWNVPATVVGSKYGFITMCLAPLAAVAFSQLFDSLTKARRAQTIPVYAGVACAIIAVPTALGPLAITPALTWICLGLNIFFAMGVQLALAVVLAQVAPGRMIGKLTACCFLCLNLFGLGFGPASIALLAGRFGSNTDSIGRALSFVVGTGWLLVGVLFLVVWNGTRTRAQRPSDEPVLS
jgi:MFS family permease